LRLLLSRVNELALNTSFNSTIVRFFALTNYPLRSTICRLASAITVGLGRALDDFFLVSFRLDPTFLVSFRLDLAFFTEGGVLAIAANS
jgi:hypothetical protein